MTAYFDEKARRLRELQDVPETDRDVEWGDRLTALEKEVVWDVTHCAACPGLPTRFRDGIHKIVVKYQVSTLPHGAQPSREADLLRPEECLMGMVEDLHSLFHRLAQARIAGFNDSPRAPMVRRFDQEEDYRDQFRRITADLPEAC